MITRSVLRLAALAFAVVAAACAEVPKTLALDASSEQSLIVFEAASADPTREIIRLPEFDLTVARYSPEEGRLLATSFGGWAPVNSAEVDASGRYWLVGRAEPGLYVISSLNHQSTWHACFNAGTRSFTVEPGQVLYVGRIDPVPALMTIESTLPSVSMNSEHLFAMDQSISLTPAAKVADWQTSVEAFVRKTYPNVTAPAEAAELGEATFNTGRDLFGVQRVCGGYYAPSDEAAE